MGRCFLNAEDVVQSGSKSPVDVDVLLSRVALGLILRMRELRRKHFLDPLRPRLLKSFETAIRNEHDGLERIDLRR